MRWETSVVRMVLKRCSLDDIEQIGEAVLSERMNAMRPEERIAFLHQMTEDYLGMVLAGLDRSRRAQLMNLLLPVVARHFPLEEVDILGTFADAQGHPVYEQSEAIEAKHAGA